MRENQMNQTTLSISCVFLASILSTVGSSWQSNKARDNAESKAVTVLTSEFASVKSSVDKVSMQMSTLTSGQDVLKTEVKALQEFRKDAADRLRALEIKVH